MTVRGLEIRFERLLFGARWLLAPLYAGMVLLMVVRLAGYESFVSQLVVSGVLLALMDWIAARTPDHSLPQR